MRLEFRPRAVIDLGEIRDYLLEHGGDLLAERVRRHFETRFDLLLRNPFIGVDTSKVGVRILSPTKYPYRIYFTILPDAIVILHVRHTARDVPDLDEM
jgi:plasmid stabilization system protein ParE